MTFKDYIAFEETTELRHEFDAGEVFAMAGGTPESVDVALDVSAIYRGLLHSDGTIRVP